MLTEGFDFLYIAFQLTIFFLLSIVVYSLIKDYLIPFLYSEMEEIKKKKKELKEKCNLLGLSEKRIKNEIEDQRGSFNVLENKIRNWKNSLEEENSKKDDFNKKLLDKVKKKRIVQSGNLSLLKTQRIVIPESIKQAYKEIKHLYGGQKSRRLLTELVEKIDSGD